MVLAYIFIFVLKNKIKSRKNHFFHLKVEPLKTHTKPFLTQSALNIINSEIGSFPSPTTSLSILLLLWLCPLFFQNSLSFRVFSFPILPISIFYSHSVSVESDPNRWRWQWVIRRRALTETKSLRGHPGSDSIPPMKSWFCIIWRRRSAGDGWSSISSPRSMSTSGTPRICLVSNPFLAFDFLLLGLDEGMNLCFLLSGFVLS